MAQALREPFALVSRCLSSPPRQPRTKILPGNPAKRQNTTAPASSASKLIAALDALNLHSPVEGEQDIDVKVFRQGRVSNEDGKVGRSKTKPTNQANSNTEKEPTMKPIHPFFCASTSIQADEAPPTIRKTTCKNTASEASGSASSGISITSISDPTPSRVRLSHPTRTSKAKPSSVILPLYSYKDYIEHKPVMVFTQVEEEANDLVTSLKAGPMALDVEWRVFFRRQRNSTSTQMTERRIAVVQVADTRGVILVVQVYGMERFPKNLQALIENPEISKVGVNILNDGRKLFRDYGILAKNLVELGAVALVADPDSQIGKAKRKIVSLVRLVEKYCGKRLAKGTERTGNWEADLGLQQLEYAANDAHSSLMVYQHLSEIARKRGLVLEDLAAEYTSNVNFNHLSDVSASVSRASSQATTVVTESSQTTDAGTADGDIMDPIVSMRPQYLRAYRFWHERGMSLKQMCIELSLKGKAGEGLKASTVISYVIGALQADASLPFEIWKLRELVQMDGASWVRHREWILNVWSERKGILGVE